MVPPASKRSCRVFKTSPAIMYITVKTPVRRRVACVFAEYNFICSLVIVTGQRQQVWRYNLGNLRPAYLRCGLIKKSKGGVLKGNVIAGLVTHGNLPLQTVWQNLNIFLNGTFFFGLCQCRVIVVVFVLQFSQSISAGIILKVHTQHANSVSVVGDRGTADGSTRVLTHFLTLE